MENNKDQKQINFEALTTNQKRVAIAKDIIQRILADQFIAKRGVYVGVVNSDEFDEDDDVKSNIDKAICNVCQIGAIIMSATGFRNSLIFSDLYEDPTEAYNDIIKDLFTPFQYWLLEYIFEDKNVGRPGALGCGYALSALDIVIEETELSADEEDILDQFIDTYPREEDRIIAMMKIIIKNKGEFDISLIKQYMETGEK